MAASANHASVSIAHVDAVTIPLLVRAHTELKKFEVNSTPWRRWAGVIARLTDDAARDYGDTMFIRMVVKFTEHFGTSPLLHTKHCKRMAEQGVVFTAVHEIYREAPSS